MTDHRKPILVSVHNSHATAARFMAHPESDDLSGYILIFGVLLAVVTLGTTFL